jgi:hypothetical protein
LQFAIREARENGGLSADSAELTILTNVADALSNIRESFAKAVRDASYDKMARLMGAFVEAAKPVSPYDILRKMKL